MIRRALQTIVLMTVCGCAAAATLMEDMVTLDRAYIPALAITNRKPPPTPELARRAMDRLNAQWTQFLANQSGARAGDANWRADLDRIGTLIAAASKIVTSGANVEKAHEELEGVRLTFLKMRERARMAYYLDHLTRFHEAMEEIYGAAKDKSGATLTDADLAKVRDTYPNARKLWAAVVAAKPDPEHKLNADQQARLTKLLAAESGAMAALEKALAGTDRGAIATAGQGIRQPFAALYISFGDFAPIEPR